MALIESFTLDSLMLNSTADANNQTGGQLIPRRTTLAIGFSSLAVGLMCLVTIVGNVAVIYAIVTTYEMREKASNIFLVNLSITDLSNAIFIMSSAFLCIAFDFHRINQTWCDCMCALNYCLIIVSMMTLALISVDRLLSVLFPFRYYGLVTKGRVVAVVVFAWCQGLVFGVAPAVAGWVHYDYWEAICAINWHHEPRSGPITYVIAAFAVCFILPSLTMLVSYTLTIRYAKKSLKTLAPAFSSSTSSGQDKGTDAGRQNKESSVGMKTINSLLVVVALFFVCLTPFSVTKLLKVLTNEPTYIPPYVNLTSSFFAYLSSMVNPFIYGIFRADFRHAYKLMFRKIAARKESLLVNSSAVVGVSRHSALADGNGGEGKRCRTCEGLAVEATAKKAAKTGGVPRPNASPRLSPSVDAYSGEAVPSSKRLKWQPVTSITTVGHDSSRQETITIVSL